MVRGSVPLLSGAGFALDAVTNTWNKWVLSYNTQRQQQLLRNLGLEATDWRMLSALLLASAAVATSVMGLLALRGLRRARQDPAVRTWARLCRKLERAGFRRAPSEGPNAYTRRVAAARPELAEPLKAIAAAYVRLRYARTDPEGIARLTSELKRQVRALKT
jgi:hypothetical protein